MKTALRNLATAAALSLAALGASAQSIHNTYTIPSLAWGFSTTHPVFSQCGTLSLDATGDIYNSDFFSMYGRLSCPALGGNYATVGSAYFDAANTFNMTMTLSVTHKMVCNNLSGSTLSGQCPIFDNLGNQTGTAFINLL